MIKVDAYSLRAMTFEDLTWVWKIRNTPEVRATSLYVDHINWPSHLNWFNSDRIKIRKIFSVMGRSVGVITVNIDNYWSFYKDPAEPDNKGLATMMLQNFIDELPVGFVLKAQVKTDNLASLRVHEKLGFVSVSSPTATLKEFQLICKQEKLCPA